jgi:peptide/nickel transport system permease protein
MVDLTTEVLTTPRQQSRKPYRQIIHRFARHQLAMFGFIFLILMGLIVIVGPWLSPYAYDAQDFNFIGMPAPMSAEHWLGTDELGRDAMTRLIHGGRVSLGVGLLGAIISTFVGAVIGAVSGFYRGWADIILMRFTDVMLSIPTLPLVLLLSTMFRPSPGLLVVVVGGLIWMGTARLVRSQFLALREREYVEAARALGAGGMRLMFRHILPNALGPITVAATLAVGTSIMLESGLSFLGFGILPPVPTWGNILNSASSWLAVAPWLAIPPGLCIFFTVLAVNFVGEGLRDAIEPRQ